MLAIRLQRRGRKGHAQYRVIVQDSRFSPKSEKIVAYLGSYDPHTKVTSIDKEVAEKYLSNGAQPSNRVATIFKAENVKLPAWVKIDSGGKGKLKNPEKLRKNRPDEPKEEVKEEAPATEESAQPEEAKETEEPKEEAKEEKPTKDAEVENKDKAEEPKEEVQKEEK